MCRIDGAKWPRLLVARKIDSFPKWTGERVEKESKSKSKKKRTLQHTRKEEGGGLYKREYRARVTWERHLIREALLRPERGGSGAEGLSNRAGKSNVNVGGDRKR